MTFGQRLLRKRNKTYTAGRCYKSCRNLGLHFTDINKDLNDKLGCYKSFSLINQNLINAHSRL